MNNLRGKAVPITGGTILALCSGLMDGVNGQVLMVDRGTTLFEDRTRPIRSAASLSCKQGSEKESVPVEREQIASVVHLQFELARSVRSAVVSAGARR